MSSSAGQLVIKMSLSIHFFVIIFAAQLGTQMTSSCLTRQKVWLPDGKIPLQSLMISDKAFFTIFFSAGLLKRKKYPSSLDMLFR